MTRKEKRLVDALIAAASRMIVGVTEEDTNDCEWYEGLVYDGIDEATVAIKNLEQAL